MTLTKENPGEEFKDLDILAKLLAPKRPEPAQPVIEVLGSDNPAETDQDEEELVKATEKLDIGHRELLEGASGSLFL